MEPRFGEDMNVLRGEREELGEKKETPTQIGVTLTDFRNLRAEASNDERDVILKDIGVSRAQMKIQTELGAATKQKQIPRSYMHIARSINPRV